VMVLLWVISLSDRYFVTHFLGLAQNGIYSSSTTIANLTQIFFMPIAYVLFPVVSRLWKQKNIDDIKSYFSYSVRLFLTAAIPGAVGIAILSQPLLRLLTTSEFLVGEELVLLLAVGMIFFGVYQININLILLGKHDKYLPFLTAAASVTSVVLNILLIPHLGLMGAAVSNCASYFVLAVIVTLWARKTLTYYFDYKYIGKVAASSLVMLIVLNFLKTSSILGIILAVILGTAVFVAGLYVLRAFTEQDKQLIKRTLTNLMPGYSRKRG
jgi:O-antigen/teichoic acid export membrane protein